jgi:prepilin-type N-terminal cleavage/methylation domain-containing protein
MPNLRDDSGLSLTELLVVSMLISVILAASYFLFGAAQSMNDMAMARASASDEAQAAIDLMSRELRQARENVADKGAFTLAGASDMKFYSDVDHDGRPDLVRYYVESGSLKRTVAPPTNYAVPFTNPTPGTPTILVKTLGTSSGPVFCYHTPVVPATPVLCGTVNHGFTIVSTTDPYNTTPKITMVGLKIDDVNKSGDKTIQVISRALVRLRTVENTVK